MPDCAQGSNKAGFFDLKRAGGYLLAAAVLLIMFLFVDQSLLTGSGQYVADAVIAAGVGACAILAWQLKRRGLLDESTLVMLILAAGFVIKLAYALKLGWRYNQHDVETLESNGHITYIYRLVCGEGLPDSNDWQFYHPPLHHLLAALVVKASLGLGHTLTRAFENIQLLTVFCSFASTVAAVKIFRALGLKGRPFVLASAIVAVHPTFTILAGSINNDILSILLMLVAVLYLIKWYSSPSWGNVAVIALAVGLAMMTKFSAALIAAAVGILVLVRFIRDKEYRRPRFIGQAALFVAVVAVLGLWYQIRMSVMFGQPLGYVAPIPTGNPLYCGDKAWWQRFLLDFSQFDHLWCEPFGDYNIAVYVLKSSVFGEYSESIGIAPLLLIANAALVIVSLIAMVRVLKARSKRLFWPKWTLFTLWAVFVAFFIYFNISAPYGCTMDFRYIVPTLISGAGFIGLSASGTSTRFGRVLTAVSEPLSAAFCALSVLYFM